MTIIEYYKKKKNKNKLIQNINIPTFAYERFWFLRKMPRNMLKIGPFTQKLNGKTRYQIDTTNVIGHTMYGKNYKQAQQAPIAFGRNGIEKLWKGVTNKHEILEHINYHEDNSKVLSLLDKGITFERLLGKEWDNDLSRSVVQQVQARTQKYNGYFSRTPDAKRGLVASKEARLTPNQAIRYMQWERMVKDPSIINNLMTRKQAEAKGYKFDDSNMPISVLTNADNEPLYDVAGMFDREQLVPDYTMNKSINDVLKDVTPASLFVFGNQLAKATNVRVISTKDIPKDEVEVKSRRFSSIAKKAKNLVKRTLGRTESALNQAVTMQVSTEGTQAERTYLLVRDIAVQSILPLIRETQKACVLNGETTKSDDAYIRFLSKHKLAIKPDNLPTYRELKANEAIIMDVAGNLIASQVVKMGNLREKESRALSELYKVDAMQLLSQVKDKDNTWMMPLIASYVGMTLPKFAKDLNTDIKKYAELNDLENVKNLTEAVFGVATWDATKGVLTRDQATPKINAGAFDVVDENYQPKVISINSMVGAFKLGQQKEQLKKNFVDIQSLIAELNKVESTYTVKTDKEEALLGIKNGFAKYEELKSVIEQYNKDVDIYQSKYNAQFGSIDEDLPVLKDFDMALIEYDAEIMRYANAVWVNRDNDYRAAKAMFTTNQVIKAARDEIFEELAKHGIDATTETSLDAIIAGLKEKDVDTTRLEYINSVLSNELLLVDVMSEMQDLAVDKTIEELMAELNYSTTPEKQVMFDMAKLWQSWIESAETEEQANEIFEKMHNWQNELITVLEQVETVENQYKSVREDILSTGKVGEEELDECFKLIEDMDVNRVKACYMLNDTNAFAKLAESSETIRNDWLWNTTKEAVELTRPVLTNWRNKCRMYYDELNYIRSIGTVDEVHNKEQYAKSFEKYIKDTKNLTNHFEDLSMLGDLNDTIEQEIAIFRSIYNAKVEQEDSDEEMKQVAEFYKELYKEDEQAEVKGPNSIDNNQRPGVKEVSILKRKLRLGIIDLREYYRGLRGISDATAKIQQADLDATNVAKFADMNAVKPQPNVVIENPVVVDAEELSDLIEKAKQANNAVIYGDTPYKPGYVVVQDKREFSIRQYNKEMSELLIKLEPGVLPDFIDGENLYRSHDVLMENLVDVSDAEVVNEFLKKAKKTIAKALKNEYNDKVQETAKVISASKGFDEDIMNNMNNRQDICGNILNHFAAKKKATQRVMEKGADYNPRFVAQLSASESLLFTAEQITTKVLTFYNRNWKLLKDQSPNTVFNLYVKSVGASKLDKAIRGEVVTPMVEVIHQESRQLA